MNTTEFYRFARGSSGNFLDPPGSPQHDQHIEGWFTSEGKDARRRFYAKRDEADLYASLDYALHPWSNTDVPDSLKRQVQALFDKAELVCSERWQRSVYAYFHNSYSPDGENRNVGDAVIDDEEHPPEHHLGYLHVKSWFPDHEPRLDLIADGKGWWGTRECVKCGARCQYEAKVDAWVIFQRGQKCEAGGVHVVNDGLETDEEKAS